jgi:hypothetical protein
VALVRLLNGILFNQENERHGETFETRTISCTVMSPSTRRAIGHAELVGLYHRIGVHQGVPSSVSLGDKG